MSDRTQQIVIRYWDGTEAQVGDTVIIDETQSGIVRDVVNNEEKMGKWGLMSSGWCLLAYSTLRGSYVSFQLISCREAPVNKVPTVSEPAGGRWTSLHRRGTAMNESARYLKTVEWSEDDQCFVGSSPGLFYGGCHGGDERQVFEELCQMVDEMVALTNGTAGRPSASGAP